MTKITLFILILFSAPRFTAQDWRSSYEQIETDFSAGQYANVITVGNEMLSELEEIGLNEDTSYVNILYYLENAYFYSGNYEQAVQVGMKQVSLCKDVYGVEHYFLPAVLLLACDIVYLCLRL